MFMMVFLLFCQTFSWLCTSTIKIRAIEQYVHVVLLVMLYDIVLSLKSANETIVCDQSNHESY